jgi:hypothetical protein
MVGILKTCYHSNILFRFSLQTITEILLKVALSLHHKPCIIDESVPILFVSTLPCFSTSILSGSGESVSTSSCFLEKTRVPGENHGPVANR